MSEFEMNKLVLMNLEGKIVCCLYIYFNGKLHPDSWICLEGWK